MESLSRRDIGNMVESSSTSMTEYPIKRERTQDN
jgi:hypothetical protein